MKGPTRLIHEDPDFARLVAASTREEPSSVQVAKALSMASTVAAASRWSLAWGSGRLTIGLATVGLAAVIGFATMRGGEPPKDDGAAARVVSAPPAPVAAETVREAPLQEAAPVVAVDALADAPLADKPAPKPAAARSITGDVSTAPPSPGSVAPPSSPASSSRGSFSEELALVSAARAALEDGDPAACLRAVDGYDARFGSGTFAQEMAVMRIEALAASGERARARILAERFLEANVKSPYAGRVRSVIERSPH